MDNLIIFSGKSNNISQALNNSTNDDTLNFKKNERSDSIVTDLLAGFQFQFFVPIPIVTALELVLLSITLLLVWPVES